MTLSTLSQIAQTAQAETYLWVAAREAAGRHGAEFSVPCAQNVKDFIRAGAKNMAREGRQGETDLEEAEKNLLHLVEAMVKSPTGTQERAGTRILREGSLVHAKRLCPLWPFA